MIELAFSPSRTIQTPWGPRIEELARPTQAFWHAWRAAKDSLRSMGVFVKKEGDDYIVGRLRDPDGIPTVEAGGYLLGNVTGLRTFQIPHSGALVASLLKNGHALDGSDTGTGKTYTALAVARELRLTPAIVCTRRNILKWSTLCRTFGLRSLFIVNWEFAKTGNLPYAITRKSGRKVQYFDWKLDRERSLLIMDEAHKARGDNTIASQMLIQAKPYKTLALSASFAVTPKDMKALGFILGFHDLLNFRKWCAEHYCFEIETDAHGNRWDAINAAEEMARLHKMIFPAHGSRMRTSEIPDFPETQITAELYEIEKASVQNAEYDRLLTEIAKTLHGEGKKANKLTLNLRYRQLAEILKVDLLVDLAKEDIENGMSVAIFVNFTQTLLALADKLKTDCIVAGESVQSHAKSMSAIRRFQNDTSRIIVLNAEAGGDSIDLHDTRGQYPRSALIPPTYNAITLKQIFGRVRRDGGKSKSIQRMIYAKGTVEEKICATVAARLGSIDALNDGDLAEPDVMKLMGG